MRKAIFLDKDGTLIPDIPFNVNPSLIELEEGVIDALTTLVPHDYLFIIISNQAGLAHGYFEEEDLKQVEVYITQLLHEGSIHLDGFYYCPHYPGATVKKFDATCSCRKPMPGLLERAAADFDIDLSQSWMIGDILNDVEAGNRAGCQTVLINNGNESEWNLQAAYRKPSFIVRNMREAATVILKRINAGDSKNVTMTLTDYEK